MHTYESRRQFSDQCMPQIKALLGRALFEVATNEEDSEYAADLRIPELRCAVRLRQSKWQARYGNEFTLRASTKSGHLSEYAKLLKRNFRTSTYFIYAFTDDYGRLTRCWLIFLPQWRQALLKGRIRPNYFLGRDGHAIVSFPCLKEYARLLVG